MRSSGRLKSSNFDENELLSKARRALQQGWVDAAARWLHRRAQAHAAIVAAQLGALRDGVTVERLLAPRTVQGYQETGLSAILHVLEHTSGHAGQIYAWTKQVTGIDLAFYDL